MAKSTEQKAADALEAGVRDMLWSPTMFARHILKKDLAVQWMILRTVIVLIKEWKRESKPADEAPYRNFSDYMDEDVQEVVDLDPWDT